MSWVDVMVILVVILIAFAESHRGFGLALIDVVGAIVGMKLALFLAPILAESASLGFAQGTAKAFWLVVLFVLLVVVTLVAGKLIYSSTLLSLDVLDPIIGALLGIVSGLLVSHVILRAMLLATLGDPFGKQLAATFAVQQLVEFRGLNHILDVARHVGDT